MIAQLLTYLFPNKPLPHRKPLQKKSMNRKALLPFCALAALTSIALLSSVAAVPVTVLNQASGVVVDTGSPAFPLESNPYTFSFDAGATADKLIVALSSELSGPGPTVITYNDVALTPVAGTINGKAQGIFYLDAPFTGGAADLVIDMTGFTVVNGIGFGVTSISGSAPGVSAGNVAAGTEVELAVLAVDSFVISNYASNTGGIPTVPVGHVELYSNGDIGSADGAAAYVNGVAPGPYTVTYGQPGELTGNHTSAAVFTPFAPPPPITVLNSDSRVVPKNTLPLGEALNENPYTISFDAGATADKLIVALSSEAGGSDFTGIAITYNDVALTNVTGTNSNRVQGIWYLDNPFSGGGADLVIDMSNFDVVNGIGFGVVSIAGSVPGVDSGTAAAGAEVSLTAPVAGSFVMSAYGSNAGNVPTVPIGHTQIYTNGNIGSADGAAAYLNGAAEGAQIVTYTQTAAAANSTGAALFLPVIKPTAPTITEFTLDGSNVTLGWTSRDKRFYTVRFSRDQVDWLGDIDDSIEPDDGDMTTYSFDLNVFGLGNEPRLFFRVDERVDER